MTLSCSPGRVGSHPAPVSDKSLGSRPRSAARILGVILFAVSLVPVAFGQMTFPTSHGDNARTGTNTNETLLTPTNVTRIISDASSAIQLTIRH